MSDAQSLKDCIIEYRKANTELDNKLNEAEEIARQQSQEREGQPSRLD